MNRKIKRFFSIVLVACMLFTIVQPHATFWAEEDSLTSELINEEETFVDSDVEIESNNTESALSSELELSPSTISEEVIKRTEIDDELESSLLSDNEEVVPQQQDILTIADEETEEPENDNWELGLVFYDSSVDNGKTPLTEIDWDASDGSYKEGTPRVITVQINYKNTNAVTTYQPGDLKIKVKNLIYNIGRPNLVGADQVLKYSVLVGANDSTHVGYDWTRVSPSVDYKSEYVEFSNANIIEDKSNFEGSIRIEYTLTPAVCSTNNGYSDARPEKYEDECFREANNTLIAELDNICISNELNFHYQRTYIHPWQKLDYNLEKTAAKIAGLDGLPENSNDFIWVKYCFRINDNTHEYYSKNNNYPYIFKKEFNIIDEIPTECIVLDEEFNEIFSKEGVYTFSLKDMTYYFQTSSPNRKGYYLFLFVGYPKSIYNEENGNLNITNTADLYVMYSNADEFEYANQSSVSLNLGNYIFSYSGNLYGITKKISGSGTSNDGAWHTTNANLYYESMIGEDNLIKNSFLSYINYSAKFTGKKYDLKIGDDILFITDKDGEYRKLNDEEYYFSQITFPTALYDVYNNMIPKDSFDIELYIRQKDNDEYYLYDSFKNDSTYNIYSNGVCWNLTEEQHVVGFYFSIKDINKTIIYPTSVYKCTTISSTIKVYNAKDIKENSGSVFNFCYLEAYIGGVLQNGQTIDNYANAMTKTDIATYDIERYGHYLQRSASYVDYNNYELPTVKNYCSISKKMKSPIQNVEKQVFEGYTDINLYISSYDCRNTHSNHVIEKYVPQLETEKRVIGYQFYDLLPEGMELISTEDEILESVVLNTYLRNGYLDILKQDGTFFEIDNFLDFIKSHARITIIENWNNTNRTWMYLFIDFHEEPLLFFDSVKQKNVSSSSDYKSSCFQFTYKYNISFDSYLEHGAVWENKGYCQFLNREYASYLYDNSTNFYGPYNSSDKFKDKNDINNNGNYDEYIYPSSSSITISSIISTHQDVTKYVKTDKSSYSTGKVDSSYDSEYEYKLRVRTGQNDVTNLVIYDSIEEYAQDKEGNIVTAYGSKPHWNGEFLGIDTSYAESKGYIVKPYYSENPLASNLYNDDGTLNPDWEEYYNPVYTNGLKIKFSDECKTYSSSDYVYIYYYQNGKYYRSTSLYGNNIAGKEIEVPSIDFYLYWHTSSTNRDFYGFSIDSVEPILTDNKFTSSVTSLPNYEVVQIKRNIYPESIHNPYNIGITNQLWHYVGEKVFLYDVVDMDSVKSLAFEYLDANGNPAKLPANSLTYVLIKMKAPDDKNITSLAYNGCRTQWQAIDEHDRPVDFITGINSNIVKVSLPNSVEDKVVNLSFKKIIDATDEDFERLKLDKDAAYNFLISLTNQETGDVINGVLDSKEGFRVTNIPTGTYIIKEEDDIWFNFVSMGLSESIEGIDFQEVDGDYILTINATVEADAAIEIDISNKPKEERFYDSKYDIKNLFNLTK